mmetsp:Transcript_53858/g.89404  ORF Transcript_53858/g.89404 Transcript_53858/m.89404 type:complete len:814 (-) Transcript_53858:3-2444(-)
MSVFAVCNSRFNTGWRAHSQWLASWPPSAGSIFYYVPFFLGFIAASITALTVAALCEKPTLEQKEHKQKSIATRTGQVEELVATLDRCFDDEDADTVGRIKFREFQQRCFDLVAAHPTAPALSRAVDWCGRLASKELRIASLSTEAQESEEYKDGRKLSELIQLAPRCELLARASGRRMSLHVRNELQVHVHKARRASKAHDRLTVWKATKVVLRAHGALPWVAAHGVVSVVHASVAAMTSFYRASVLESCRSSSRDRKSFVVAACALAYVELTAAMLKLLKTNLRARGASRMVKEVQLELFRALLKKEQQWWAATKASEHHLMRLLFECHRNVDEYMGIPQKVLTDTVTLITNAALISKKSSFTLYVLLAINYSAAGLRVATHSLQKWLGKLASRGFVQPSRDEFTWVYALRPSFAALFQSFVRGGHELEGFRNYIEASARCTERDALGANLVEPLSSAFTQAATVGQLGAAGLLVERGLVGTTEADALISQAGEVNKMTRAIEKKLSLVIRTCRGLGEVFDHIASPPGIDPDDETLHLPVCRARGVIEFDNVRFAYPGRDGEVLKGASFAVEAGRMLGITGQAGSGKSTALHLLERFYDVSGGRVLLDGRDVREYNVGWLRSQIATVSQEPVLLPITIRENIALGCAVPPSIEQIEAACEAANILKVLSDRQKFPEGLRTVISQVQNISGGEKQRIAIARAILANPPVLLLDEATSALDEENQRLVQAALNRLMVGRTTLVVAHRLSTICNADQIVTFDDGKVAEQGTHQELIDRPQSLYGKLWRMQTGHGSGMSAHPRGVAAHPHVDCSS